MMRDKVMIMMTFFGVKNVDLLVGIAVNCAANSSFLSRSFN